MKARKATQAQWLATGKRLRDLDPQRFAKILELAREYVEAYDGTPAEPTAPTRRAPRGALN